MDRRPRRTASWTGCSRPALLGHVTGNPSALPTLVDQVHALMPLTLSPLPRAEHAVL